MYRNITNHYDPGHKRPKLCCDRHFIFHPNDAWNYAHHPSIVWFKGRYFVSFSNGHCHEDDVGQLMRYTVSEDFTEWQPSRVLATPPMHEGRESVLLPGGWHTDGETLVAYYNAFAYDEAVLKDGHRINGNKGRTWLGSFYITSMDGETWSEPTALPSPGGIGHPVRLRSGRLLSPGSMMHAYSDNPDGIHGWTAVQAYPAGYPNNQSFDNGEGIEADTPTGLVKDTLVGLCEGSFVQRDDGTITMFLRSGTPWLWACESRDDGGTWSLPQPTRFSDNRTKACFGRLPNGRFYYLGTPDPFPPRTRHVLALSTSDDGLDFDRHYLLADAQYKGTYPGIDKNGVYGYPSALARDGYLHVIVSINKEAIMALRVPCDTL